MRRLIVVAAALLLAAAALPPSGASETPRYLVDGEVGDWQGESTMLGGTWHYSSGEFVYQDHIYDDYGANTGQRSPNHSSLANSSTRGDVRYPTNAQRFGSNAADISQIRFALDGETVHVLVTFNTLLAADTTVVAIAIDSDPSAEPAGGRWPHDAGLSTPGADHVLTIRGGAADLTALAPAQPGPTIVPSAVDTTSNAFEASFPRGDVGGTEWKVWAASGLWDGAAWMPIRQDAPTATQPGYGGSSLQARAFNVAFRDDEDGAYAEMRQADALAAGDISPFSATVQLSKLVAREHQPYVVQTGRTYAAIAQTSFSIPPLHEGMDFSGIQGRGQGIGGQLAQSFRFYGRAQPYAVYLPKAYDGTTALPLILNLHGHGGSHLTYNTQPGFVRDMGENPSTIIVAPLGRGSSFYSDYGERDVLDVLDDVAARFVFDRERVYLAGYSMGGYGVYRLGSLYPDRFAAAVTWAGYTGEYTGRYLTDYDDLTGDPGGVKKAVYDPVVGQPFGGNSGKAAMGNPVDVLQNMRYLPLLHLAGTNDEIVPTTGQIAGPRRLQKLGYRHRLDLYPGYEHFSFALVDDWKEARAWLGDQRREASPRRLTYALPAAWTEPQLAGLGIEHGRAWWLSGLQIRSGVDQMHTYGTIDATSEALPAERVETDDHVGAYHLPTPHVWTGTGWVAHEWLPIRNALRADLRNLSFARIDAARAGLLTDGLEVTIVTDGAATVRVEGDFRNATAQASGGTANVADGSLTIEAAGPGTVTVSVIVP